MNTTPPTTPVSFFPRQIQRAAAAANNNRSSQPSSIMQRAMEIMQKNTRLELMTIMQNNPRLFAPAPPPTTMLTAEMPPLVAPPTTPIAVVKKKPLTDRDMRKKIIAPVPEPLIEAAFPKCGVRVRVRGVAMPICYSRDDMLALYVDLCKNHGKIDLKSLMGNGKGDFVVEDWLREILRDPDSIEEDK